MWVLSGYCGFLSGPPTSTDYIYIMKLVLQWQIYDDATEQRNQIENWSFLDVFL
jgi:hypothetical protein